MNNAGVKNTEINFEVKEVYLDKALIPVNNANASFIVKFYYDETKNLSQITFIPTNSNKFKEFSIGKDIIERYSSFKRADDAFMNVLRKRSLELKNLISLKKYVFECQKFIN